MFSSRRIINDLLVVILKNISNYLKSLIQMILELWELKGQESSKGKTSFHNKDWSCDKICHSIMIIFLSR